MLLFVFVLPAVQVVFFCVAVGHTPQGLKLGIINKEVGALDTCQMENNSEVVGCVLNLFSCKIFKSDNTVDLISYSHEYSAYQDVVAGHIWGLIYIPENFTAALISQFSGGHIGNNSARVSLDLSNSQIGVTLQQWLAESVQIFTKSILHHCGMSEDMAAGPITFQDAIYGDQEPSYTEFMVS